MLIETLLLAKKIEQTVNSWITRPLSQVRRLVMIKLVPMTYPTYVMSCYCFPKKITKLISCLISKFGTKGMWRRERLHGMVGLLCVKRLVMGDWELGIWKALIKLCWQKLVESFFINHSLYLFKF